MPSRSMSGMRACGSNPPGRPSTYFIVASAATSPCRDPMAPMTPKPFWLPRTCPSTRRRSLPSVSMTIRGARSRKLGSMYLSQMSTGSSTWPSASMTL
jgi:hypothetical protein